MKRVLIVDGYNVIHRDPELSGRLAVSLEAGRDALARYCAEWRGRHGGTAAMYLVFDGDSSVVGAGSQTTGGVEVLYTASREQADDRIRALLDAGPADIEFVVVTDDRGLAEGARSRRAGVMSVQEFRGAARASETGREGPGKPGLSTEAARRINEELKRLWNIAD